ncbi:lysophospholipid acyltransferase family protein [Thiocystis violascens]|uniref:1-acyl-sn-glycerol-3-phosphate acyltransferase n=1 Tax=Thiocystis violascens (strain ATCC 17096 / DSM 198 / 6111) TaxID=765911 RepID=I3YDU7_THIV6|nr:lysophospholipid acyltransferase family protein [Thiocystis violascens]AFL75165.1 1-acyl-sn-glycerol-3-phosphate acyltransferase [Thiocystis violascens DSM 198]
MTIVPLTAELLAGLTRLITAVSARWVGGAPSDGFGAAPRVYFANHTSHLDTLVIWAALPRTLRQCTRPVAAADYWNQPGVRCWLATRVLNALLIDRSGRWGSRDSLRGLTAALDAGASLILFPEGTRGDGSEIGELRPGLYFVARQRPAVDLVPVRLQNLSRILPKGEVLPVPILGSAIFGAPLRLEPGEDRVAFLERARAALTDLGEPR